LTLSNPDERSVLAPNATKPNGGGKLWSTQRGRTLARLAVSLLLAAGFVWLLRRGGLPLVPRATAFGRLRPWGVPAYVSLLWLATYFRTFRWLHLLRPIAPGLSRFRVLGIGFVGYSAVFLAPLRMGEMVRPYLLSRDREVTFLQALGTVGAERVIDGLFLTVLSFVALALANQVSPLPDRLGDLQVPVSAVPAALYGALTLFALALLAMVVFYSARAWARRAIELTIGLVSPRLSAWVTGTLERLADGLSFLPSRIHLLRFVRDTGIYWGLGVAAQCLLLRAVGLPATLAEACVIIGVMGLGTLIPAGPGFFGAYQLSGFTALALFYPAPEVLSFGAAFVFISYCTVLSTNLLSLVPGFWLMGRFRPSPRAVA
jgi:glycosyltransferase 2 family protein